MKKFKYTKIRYFMEEQDLEQMKKRFFVGFMIFLLTLIFMSLSYISSAFDYSISILFFGIAMLLLSTSIILFLTIDHRRY